MNGKVAAVIRGKARSFCLRRKIPLENGQAPKVAIRALKKIYGEMTAAEKQRFLNT